MPRYKIAFESSLGRHAVSTQDISQNQVIMTTKAFSWSISDSYKKKLCAKCLSVAPTFFSIKCSCDQLYYCSEECMQSHDRICLLLRKLATLKSPSHDKNVVKLLVMTLYNLFNLDSTLEGYNHPKNLQSHFDDWSGNDQKDWNKMKKFILPLLREADLESDPDEFMHWVSKIESNGFGIWGPGKDVCMGRAVFPEASYFNHSCKPNLACEQDGTVLRIVSLENIPKGIIPDLIIGSQLFISYIDTNLPYQARQAKLWQDYYFKCICDKCEYERSNGSIKISYPESTKKKPRNKNKLLRKSRVNQIDVLR